MWKYEIILISFLHCATLFHMIHQGDGSDIYAETEMQHLSQMFVFLGCFSRLVERGRPLVCGECLVSDTAPHLQLFLLWWGCFCFFYYVCMEGEGWVGLGHSACRCLRWTSYGWGVFSFFDLSMVNSKCYINIFTKRFQFWKENSIHILIQNLQMIYIMNKLLIWGNFPAVEFPINHSSNW